MRRDSTGYWAGWLSMAGALGFAAIVATLHFIQPGYDGRHQLMSELALGPHGWAMLPAFCLFALSIVGAQHGLATLDGVSPIRALLIVAALCLVGAGVFRLGDATELHISLVVVAFILVVLAMYLVPSRARGHRWPLSRAACWGLAAGAAVSLLGAHMALPIGIGQRLAAACLLTWLGLLGWRLVRRQSPLSRAGAM